MSHRHPVVGTSFLLGLLCVTAVCATAGRGQEPTTGGFDASALQPRVETGALRFLESHPEYDGRGVVVAIFDTGVDPGAPGLQTTPTGEPKVIDMVDGTGSGDVDTSQTRAAKDGELIGLTGRSLKLHPSWLKENKQFHVGMKPAFELFPSELVPRVKRDRREERQLQIDRLRAGLRIRSQQLAGKGKAKQAEKQRVDEQLKALDALAGSEDLGPVYDCVVFRLGGQWRAVVDTDEDGDLRDEVALTNYRDEHRYGTFGARSGYNFAVNIYEQGNLLSIVADAGDHGTHVAGIVGAYFPDREDLNGVAPGVQIVSVKIGDTRLDGMETPSGLVRGLIAAKRAGCDLINMSFGEPTRTPNRGRVPEHFTDFVNKHGIIYISSAGNAGPALSTAGAPGATLTAAIGVGAYISPAMMRSEYVMDGKLPEMPYTWTSRGPTFDGDMAVDIFAPGGAISPVPNWTQQRVMRMNGTSMASPNTCGSVALMLSGMKQLELPYNVQSVRRALANTARTVPGVEVFAQGPGLVQVDAAFDYLRANVEAPAERLEVRAELSGQRRGIYLREAAEVAKPSTHTVQIKPIFPEDADNATRVDFELRLALSSTADWAEVGSTVLLTHGGQTLRVTVNPTELSPGVHTAWVMGHDAENVDRGPLVRLPITVVIPDEMPQANQIKKSIQLSPGEFHRTFVQVPAGAQWADLKLHRKSGEVPGLFVVHTVQILDDRNYRDSEFQQYLNLEPGEKSLQSFAVTGGRVMELCVCQYWSTTGDNEVDFELTFRGITPSNRTVTLIEGTPGLRLDLTNHLGDLPLSPIAQLTTHRQHVAPSSSAIKALASDRDRLPDGRVIHRLELTYELEQKRAGNVTLHFPGTEDWLYDSPFGGHVWTVHDQHGRLVYTDDIWTSPVQLKPGQHTVRLILRHEEADELKKYEKMPMAVDRPLAGSIGVSISNAQWNPGAPLPSHLESGAMTTAYVHTPQVASAGAVAGDQLLGTIKYAGPLTDEMGASGKPGQFPIQLIVTSGQRPTASPSNSSDKSEATDLEQAVGALHELDSETKRKLHLDKVVKAADQVIEMIDQDSLAMHFGRRIPEGDDEAAKTRQAMESERGHLIDALYRKGRALGYMELPEVLAKHPIADREAHSARFEANYRNLSQWVDPTSEKYFLLAVRRHRRNGDFGKALNLLHQHMGQGTPDYWHYKKQRDLMVQLGWTQLAEQASSNLIIRFPNKASELPK